MEADPKRPYKAIVAIIGAAITAALGIVPADSTLWQVLTIAAAALTAAAVFLTPNPLAVHDGEHVRLDPPMPH